MKKETKKEPSAAACGCGDECASAAVPAAAKWKTYVPVAASFGLLMAGLVFDQALHPAFFSDTVRVAWYLAAYLPVGLPVVVEGVRAARRGEIFTEYTLMSVATAGAFAIGECPEGVAVMLFYAVGELFQDAAVRRARRNIRSLLDLRPATATVWRHGSFATVAPGDVAVGEMIQVKAGERVPLDGELLSDAGRFNTAALTGESTPRTLRRGEQALAGMVNGERVVALKVSRTFDDSALAKILALVQQAASRKARTELFIRRMAKIYTPAVFLLAILLTATPVLFLGEGYVLTDWLYRGLVFLVVSCPCALVISIPLGYFGGIGAAARHGILFKGANYLDRITGVNTVVMDKTGTLTKGVFKVQAVVAPNGNPAKLLMTLAALEKDSTHPIARAIVEHAGDAPLPAARHVEELPGLGLVGQVCDRRVLAGNTKLMQRYSVRYDPALDTVTECVVLVAIDRRYAGYVLLADELKDDALCAIQRLYRHGIERTVMLSGDKESITQQTARQLGIQEAYGGLLPADKWKKVEALKSDPTRVVAFVGDGINDAPVLAISDVGIAMGALGSDAAIETADVVIQTDHPSKIATALQIGKDTKNIVLQNIALAVSVKIVVLLLAAWGVATLWEAVFADVGVALLAILNAVRMLRKKYE
jgi:Cd2+/Zn2+-exporting ATPase